MCSRRLANDISPISSATVPDSIFDRSRMSLIRLSRSVPARVDRAGELDLLLGEVALRVVGQHLRQDQQAVERRAQLVAHVGQELGLVLRGQRQLLGLFLDRAAWPARPRGSSLPPAASRSRAAGPSPAARRWSLQLFLLAGQLGLAGLQLLRQQLRLLEQLLGPHVRGDRVEHDADGLRQLVEEGVVGLVELARTRPARSPPSPRPRTAPAGR